MLTTESETQTDHAVCVSDSVRSEPVLPIDQGDSKELRQKQVKHHLLQLKIASNVTEASEMAKNGQL